MLTFVEKIKLQSSDLLVLYKGKNTAEENFFAYIICNKNQLETLRNDFEGNISRPLIQYGEVLYIDFQDEPDDKANQFLNNWVAKNGGEFL